MRGVGLLLILFLWVAHSEDISARKLDAMEKRIVAAVEEEVPQAIRFLERIVNINSGTMNLNGVRRVGELFREELDQLGFQTRWIPMEQVARAGHLFAEREGNRGKRVLLIGHLDTVFEEDSPFQTFRREGSRAYGPGVEDMKGGDVVLLYALKALHRAEVLEGARIIVALTGDEEDTGDPLSISRKDLLEAGHRCDVALGFEGGEIDKATVARRGFTGWQLRIKARPGHSSQIFQSGFGSGAIYEIARILFQFHQEFRGEENLSLGPGIILGGTSVDYDPVRSRGSAFGKTNVIPQLAVAAGDLRFLSEEQREQVKARMGEIVRGHLPMAEGEIVFEDSYPPMSPKEGNHRLLSMLDEITRSLGYGPVRAADPRERGAADISFVAPLVEAALDGLGAVGTGAHTLDEEINLQLLPVVIQRAALLLYRLTQEEGGED